MTRTKHPGGTRRVVIFALPGASSLDAVGSYEVLLGAARLLALRTLPEPLDPKNLSRFSKDEFAYDVQLVGACAGEIESMSGLSLRVTDSIVNVLGPVDTLIVAGGDIRRMLKVCEETPNVKIALQRVARSARRLASVCTGAFVLASAGLLDGKRVTTHWAASDLLQRSFPAVKVERAPIFTQDGNVYTSAGATAGMDLALAFVREDHGSELAREIARWLVLYVERSASQSQLSLSLRGQVADRNPLQDLQLWIVEHLTNDLSVAALASQVGMSVRNFARAFKRGMSMTPAAYVEGVRVEAARRKLEMGNASIEQVATEVGFGSVDTMRRAFIRETGLPPSACRGPRLHAKTEAESQVLRLVANTDGR